MEIVKKVQTVVAYKVNFSSEMQAKDILSGKRESQLSINGHNLIPANSWKSHHPNLLTSKPPTI